MKKYSIQIIIGLILFMFGSVHAQNYLNNRISVDVLYKRNLGNFSEVWSNSIGGYVGYGIAFPDHNLLILRTGVIVNQLKAGIGYKDASSVVIPLHIGGRYYFTDKTLMPFVSFMNGLNLVFENTDLEGNKENKTLVKYAWQVGLGFSVNLSNNLALDGSVNYNSHFYLAEAMMTGFEYIVGFAWAFLK